MKKESNSFLVNIILAAISILSLLCSYWLKKYCGLIIYAWLFFGFICVFVSISLVIILFSKKRIWDTVFQVGTFLILFLINRFQWQDNFAMLFEIPKIEKNIRNGTPKGDMKKLDDYVMVDWEPGFLDYQEVLIYDEKDLLKNLEEEYKSTSDGKLYVLKHPKKCFYLCMIYR